MRLLECGLTNALKKVCSMKDEVVIGDVVYEKDGYAIHKIDGEEHKVWHSHSWLFDRRNF